MSKVLQLVFNTMGGSKRTFNIVNPAEPVDPVTVKAAMDKLWLKISSMKVSLVSIELV
ncbi:DUF2922 domain-containing protein [Bacillus sp. FJAT-45350]|uniref:DUF2922 domain-containing protein n=1 Tax=Bacillus sp. FJAT-45350 TaxID=2011014 RepID=UPI000BB8DABB|nr:DUF2922 domain-containing protein [Bacillus sp. FJAT-45350]